MAEVTYYFDTRHETSVWTTNPDWMVDNILTNYASTTLDGDFQRLIGNNCPGTNFGAITKIEIRAYAYGDVDDELIIRPKFLDGLGDDHVTVPGVAPGSWGAWQDITTDPNAPDWSRWAQVQDLECDIELNDIGKGNTMYCAKVEIRVTYDAWVPPESDIDVGAEPIYRPEQAGASLTLIDKNNPANANGILHTIKVYALTNVTGLKVGTFYTTNGNTLKCRDSVVIGAVEAGAERTFGGLSLAVETGDYIGCYFATGTLAIDPPSGMAGVWWNAFDQTDPGDEATYTLIAGEAMSLYGYGDFGPPVVTTQAVADISQYTATGHGTIVSTGGFDCSKRGVCWNLTGNPTVADDKSEETDSFGSGAFTRPITGLSPGTHYYVKAYAYSSEGYGYGDQVEFDSLALAPPTVSTQAVADIEKTTATGHGTIVSTGGLNCSKRGVCWNLTGNPTVADDKSEETDSFGTGAFSRPMTGLIAGTHYYVKAYAYNSEGYGYGDQVEFDTTWDPPVADIDVGADPINRWTALTGEFTYIDKNNPANAGGTLQSVKVYAAANISGLRVGTFYTTNGNTLKCRDSVVIGDVTAGSEQTFSGLSITVVEGDYIGCYFSIGGSIEFDVSGLGIWYIEAEHIDPNDEAEYTFEIDSAMSLYGYGDIEVLNTFEPNMAAKMLEARAI